MYTQYGSLVVSLGQWTPASSEAETLSCWMVPSQWPNGWSLKVYPLKKEHPHFVFSGGVLCIFEAYLKVFPPVGRRETYFRRGQSSIAMEIPQLLALSWSKW